MNERVSNPQQKDIELVRRLAAREDSRVNWCDTRESLTVDRWQQEDFIAASSRLADMAERWNAAQHHLSQLTNVLHGVEFDDTTRASVEAIQSLLDSED